MLLDLDRFCVIFNTIVLASADRFRLSDSIETALKLGDGLVLVNIIGGEDTLFSEKFACPDCGISIEELEPRLFSFNSPFAIVKCLFRILIL